MFNPISIDLNSKCQFFGPEFGNFVVGQMRFIIEAIEMKLEIDHTDYCDWLDIDKTIF